MKVRVVRLRMVVVMVLMKFEVMSVMRFGSILIVMMWCSGLLFVCVVWMKLWLCSDMV